MAKIEYMSVEQSVLGLVLDDGSILPQVALAEHDFSQQSHRVIFNAINEVANKGLAIDLISVGEVIEKKYLKVDMEYMAKLIACCTGTAVNISHFVGLIKQASRFRQAQFIANEMQLKINSNDDCEDVVDVAIKKLMEIDTVSKNYNHTIGEAADSALELYDKASEQGGLIGIKTGLSEIDDALGGFHDSDLLVIGARPAMGKTALLFNFAHACNVPCGIISAEQNYTQAGLRFISMEGEINSQHLRSAKLTQDEFQKLPATITNLKSKEIYFNDEPGININAVMRQARIWKQSQGIKILFVDYIQKIKGSSNKQFPRDRVSEVVSSLKDLGRELNIPIVALSQVNREADKLTEPPGPSNLADASTVENEADSIITMWKNEDMKANNQMLLHICKNRHGPCGDKVVNYLGKFFKFTDQGPVEAGY